MKKLFLLTCGAAILGGAFWIGRSSNDAAGADAPQPSGEVVRADERARIPTRAARPRPELTRRTRLAGGLAADLIAADPKIRRAAVAEAARDADPDPQIMLAASRDPDLGVARAALASLGTLYADGQVSTKDMIALASDRTIPDRVRIAALNGLGAVPEPDAAAVLVKMLATGNTLERRSAAALLGNQDPEIAVPALIAALGDTDEYVPIHALDSLRQRSRGRDFGTDAGAWQAWWQSRR
jgi:HEAT repeat protein